jgi:hypothetical protein
MTRVLDNCASARLMKYCQHLCLLQEPNYQLDIICGVHMESRSHTPPRFYHANFLASAVAANGDIIQSRERTLFFAEFWELPWDPRPSSSIWYPGYAYHGCVPYGFASSCCPVYDYDACIGEPSFVQQQILNVVTVFHIIVW